jgi:hypothetical protein
LLNAFNDIIIKHVCVIPLSKKKISLTLNN